MSDFQITFSNPWLLLLLIPAAALTLFTYFRFAKKYRRNRNRVVSAILHSLVMLLCVTVLAGVAFSYDVPNRENEIILLVDRSHSSRETRAAQDDFVQTIVEECGEGFRVGVVTFGYNQVYAAPVGTDTKRVINDFLNSNDPDTSASDFASALRYAAARFERPETGKIVVVSDGVETDGNALGVIKSIAASGIRVDTAHLPAPEHSEVQIVGVDTVDYNINVGEVFTLGLKIKHNLQTGERVNVTLTDVYNGEERKSEPQEYELTSSTQTLDFKHTVSLPGMHELRFEIDAGDSDTLAENNTYYTYVYLNAFDHVLIIEKVENESQQLADVLREEYTVTVMNVDRQKDELPQDLKTLCEYHQVILVNIANSDLPEGFDRILYDYVNRQGGGLFTVGGQNDIDPLTGRTVSHAYNREDMRGTLLQQPCRSSTTRRPSPS